MKYHVNSYGGDTNAFNKGLSGALQLALRSTKKSLLIRIGQLSNSSGIMSSVLGEQFVKKLIKDKRIDTTINGISISIFLEGDQTKRSGFASGVVFCPWATNTTLNTVIKDHRATDVVYVPWTESERDNYITSNPDSTEL